MWTDQRGSEILLLPECLRLLAKAAKDGSIGRLGVSTAHAPIIQPVNFALHYHQVVLRLGPGLMAEAASGSLVAFEIDQVDCEAHLAWSVLVRGLALPVSEPALVASVVPIPLVSAPGDIVLVVRLDVVTGRRFKLKRARPEGGRRLARRQPAPRWPRKRTKSTRGRALCTSRPRDRQDFPPLRPDESPPGAEPM
jgi:hypothetical protein